jgi:hypothetical protein
VGRRMANGKVGEEGCEDGHFGTGKRAAVDIIWEY